MWLIILLTPLRRPRQPGRAAAKGSWELGPALIACFAAVGPRRTAAIAVFLLSAEALIVSSAHSTGWAAAVALLLIAVAVA